jgi:creatinine amidohydrolase
LALTLLPVGSREAHGPHLPPETDTIMAVHLAHIVASKLNAQGTTVSVAEPFVATASLFAKGFAGTVSVPPSESLAALIERVRTLQAAEGGEVEIVNLHFDPAHVGVLRQAVLKSQSAPVRLHWVDYTRRRNALRIGGEFATGSCHAGEFETSLMLAAAPEKVDPSFQQLPSFVVDLAAAIRSGRSSFREVGMVKAYCGSPAEATAEKGHALFEVLANILVEERAQRRK